MNYEFLLWIALILISTKVLGLLCKAVHLPEVVGALLAGVILGPSALGLMSMEGDTGTLLTYVAEMGVIFLMFSAGLDTDLKELKANIGASFVTALIGVIVPLIGGMIGYALYFGEDLSNYDQMLQSLFVGVVLTATSVSITVETLREMGRLSGKVGMTILGAAIIDDIGYGRSGCCFQHEGYFRKANNRIDQDCIILCIDPDPLYGYQPSGVCDRKK